ncbi:MAG: AAA15 family ATPase/GTPase [bacterium]|jgi:AAA15 family ATPase/GTPase
MLQEITIKNFKSIQELNFKPGRVNLFIGENGCGKSNILEALALAGGAESGKLDNEFLSSRGIRVTDPTLMRSAFTKETQTEPIEITFQEQFYQFPQLYTLENDNQSYSKWKSKRHISSYIADEQISEFKKSTNASDEEIAQYLEPMITLIEGFPKKLMKSFLALNFSKEIENSIKLVERSNLNILPDFLIYSPENTALRNFYKEGQVEPLGINGEGLLKLLKLMHVDQDKEKLEIIFEGLDLFDWFKNIEINDDLSSEQRVKIEDHYLESWFDQRSANEGFLFILFYITLIVSDKTPAIFAIDNIDASLNPKLCTRLIQDLVKLAKKFDKQLFLTTHNPAILDGIDLNDEEQKLFVVSRNRKGHTRLKQIDASNKPKSSTDEPLKLSEAMLRGYIGGLPKGF